MKNFSKFISAGLSALMLMAGSSVAAGAVSVDDCQKLDVLAAVNGCNLTQCGDMQSILNQLCPGGNCDIQSVIGRLQNGQLCPFGICDTPAQTTPAPEIPEIPQPPVPSEPSVPSPEPQTPTEKPAEPSQPSEPSDPSVSSEFNTAYEDEVIRLVNAQRAKYGLSPLQKDTGAVSVAHLRAKEIVQSFSHTRPNGTSCFTAAKELGVSYSTAGENIAYGYGNPEQVVNGWMNSEGHRKNILSASYSKIGVGCYKSGNVLYWSQFFIG